MAEDLVSLVPYVGQTFRFAGKPIMRAATKIATNELVGNAVAYGINEGIYSADNWARNNIHGYDEKVSPYASAATAVATNVLAPYITVKA